MSIKGIVDSLARAAGAVPPVDRDQRTLTDGTPVTDDHRELKSNGQQKDYVVLSEEERKRGFVRPVRRSYVHVGRPGPKYPLRDLTSEERGRYDKYGYVKYEEYPRGSSCLGKGVAIATFEGTPLPDDLKTALLAALDDANIKATVTTITIAQQNTTSAHFQPNALYLLVGAKPQ